MSSWLVECVFDQVKSRTSTIQFPSYVKRRESEAVSLKETQDSSSTLEKTQSQDTQALEIRAIMPAAA